MKYLIMETHLSYAVALDELGRFVKCANRNYQVGQTVTDIIPMIEPEEPVVSPRAGWREKAKRLVWIPSLATVMLLILVVSFWMRPSQAFASVFIAINPQVRIDIDQKETVIGLEGMNDDGKQLIREYVYREKFLDTVMEELIDRAIDAGFLAEGGRVRIDLDTRDAQWQKDKGALVREHLENHLKNKIKITIQIDGKIPESEKILIPVSPAPAPAPAPPPSHHDTEYGDSEYGDSEYGSDRFDDDSSDDDGNSPYDEDDSEYDDTPSENSPYHDDGDDSDYDDSDYDD